MPLRLLTSPLLSWLLVGFDSTECSQTGPYILSSWHVSSPPPQASLAMLLRDPAWCSCSLTPSQPGSSELSVLQDEHLANWKRGLVGKVAKGVTR